MPTPPSWLDKVNYVVRYWQDPCHAPLLVYLELAAAPAGNALLAWFSFGLDDVLRGYLRPSQALGSNVRGRRGKRRGRVTRFTRTVGLLRLGLRKTPGFGDDVGNWIGKNLPGANLFKGRQISAGEKFLWIADGVAQRALLYLLIADIAIDFAYEWATALNESEFCKRDHAGSLYATGPGSPAGGVFICNTGNAPDVLWAEGGAFWNVTTGGVPGGKWHFVSAMVVRNNGPSPVTHYQQVQVNDASGNRFEFTGQTTIGPGQEGSSIFSIPLSGGGSVVVNHCALGGVVQGISHDVTFWGQTQ